MKSRWGKQSSIKFCFNVIRQMSLRDKLTVATVKYFKVNQQSSVFCDTGSYCQSLVSGDIKE